MPSRFRLALLALVGSALLGACTFGATEDSGLFSSSDRNDGPQPVPQNYRSELLPFMRAYLNDPTGVKSAQLAEPVQKEVGGHQRYVTCLRYSAKNSDGVYQPVKDRAVVYVNGRLDRMLEQTGDICNGASYAPFPALETMTR